MVNLAPTSFEPKLRRPNHESRARFRSIKWPSEIDVAEVETTQGQIAKLNPVFNPPIRILRISERVVASTNLGVQVKLIGVNATDKVFNNGTIGIGDLQAVTGIASEDLIVLQTENGINLTTE